MVSVGWIGNKKTQNIEKTFCVKICPCGNMKKHYFCNSKRQRKKCLHLTSVPVAQLKIVNYFVKIYFIVKKYRLIINDL